jgi:hypothetical protein
MSKKLVAKTIARTLVYQILLLWTGFSIGFMINPEYWGNRAPVVERSIRNIFYPIKYDERVKEFCINIGRSRVFFSLPEGANNFKIIKDDMVGEEQYIATYQYMLDGETILVKDFTSKINWKPWEFDYPTPDELKAQFPES